MIAKLSGELGYPTSEDQASQRLERILGREDQAVFVAEVAGRGLLGWVHVFEACRLSSDAFAELGGIVVDESTRGLGVGRRLVEAAERWSQDSGLGTMRVRSNVVRHDTHAFYGHHGFERTKDQAVFVKRLRLVE